jgi:nucleotide-binding universal stress UspA family protein
VIVAPYIDLQMAYRILVPHDGTEMSDKALEKAIEFAKALGAEIILVHVIEDISVPPTITLASGDFIGEAKKGIVKHMEKWWDKLAEVKMHEMEDKNVKASSRCLFGDAAERIIRFTEDNKVDLVVMGSRRLKGASRIKALGSVARKVSEIAECPVLIVH